MAFLKKDVMLAEAKRLGLEKDLEGLTWADQQKLVKEALEAEGKVKAKPIKKVYHLEDRGPRGYATTMIAPEIPQTKVQLIKYDEDLGEETINEEVSFGLDDFASGRVSRDMQYATYRQVGKTGKRVVAQSTVPWEQFGMRFNPETDWAPTVKDGIKVGYLWLDSGMFKGIKSLLMDTGYYEDVRSRFDSLKGTLWYASNKVLVCDISTAHKAMRDIEKMAREDRALADARRM